ncbi:MAG: transglutaminase [Verrucomicrobiales bacterium]|nr:transglutaminase [Verrucomicrobiales bacterium]|tara:strand:+ start:12555 stop:13493 length:939 start_codon:yes stop_codon:yes gene_type:complete
MKTILTTLIALTAASGFATEKTIVRNTDRFELVYQLTVPKLAEPGTLWIPLARPDAHQKFDVLTIQSSLAWHRVRDKSGQNDILVMKPKPTDHGQRVTIRYQVTRREKRAHHETGDPKVHLRAERLVPLNARFTTIAKSTTAKAKDDHDRARALYRHVLDHMRYSKTGKGWGRGDALYACDARTGNCTDFHAYFIALCRAINIPARFAIGFTIPADKDAGAIGGYHCWAEFHANGKWIPVDISEADKHPELANYYFGHHPANRLELSRGRDIAVKPAPKSGPFNYFFGPHLEVNGREIPVKATFEFKRLPPQ